MIDPHVTVDKPATSRTQKLKQTRFNKGGGSELLSMTGLTQLHPGLNTPLKVETSISTMRIMTAGTGQIPWTTRIGYAL